MAQAFVAPSMESLTGIDAKLAALSKLEALAEEADAAMSRKKSNGILRRAIKSWKRHDIARAAKLSLEATEVDDTNAKAFHVLAMALEKMGHRHKALVTYERAFNLDPDDPELLVNLGLTAWNLKLHKGARRMFELYIAACPDSPLGYNNLGSVQSDMGEHSLAIDTLKSAIMRLPAESILWNALATVLAEEGRAEESLVFYREAIRLDPEFARLYHNLGYAYQHLGKLDEALEAYDAVLTRTTDPAQILETRHSRSICLIGMGKLEEGFAEYEVRTDPQFRAYVNHLLKSSLWKGEDLAGKRIVVVGEQGLGDEFMFANALPDVQRLVGPEGKLQIAVDERLVSLFQRSFPQAEVGAYDDRTLLDKDGNKPLRFVEFACKDGDPDYYAPMGTLLHVLRKRIEDFRHEVFLTPDPERVAKYRATLGEGTPLVGICWRSMMLDAKRSKYYSTLDMWGPILTVPGVRFVNLQYGDCARELEEARAKFGIDIRVMDDLDLKNDIEGAAALSAALDLVISAPTAAAACAAAVGAETWYLTAGRTWPQLGTDEFPWFARTKVIAPEKFGDWKDSIARAGERLKAFVAP